MIVFDLRCRGGHVFEAWFGSSADYDEQCERGLVECPVCGDSTLEKAVMAPRLGKGAEEPSAMVSTAAAEAKALLGKMAAAQRKLLENSTNVGDNFAEEARAAHLGEREPGSIHGRATRDQAASLIEDGVPVAPLPFPVIDPASEN